MSKLRTKSEKCPDAQLGQVGESAQTTITRRDAFIRFKMDNARYVLRAGNIAQALRLFGEGIHPVMDASSPMHTDAAGNPRIWEGAKTAIGHSPNDTIGKERSVDITPAIYAQQDREIFKWFVYVFGRPGTTSLAKEIYLPGFNSIAATHGPDY